MTALANITNGRVATPIQHLSRERGRPRLLAVCYRPAAYVPAKHQRSTPICLPTSVARLSAALPTCAP